MAPDDDVPVLHVDRCTMSVLHDDVSSFTVRFLSPLPLKIGERVEVELVEIERRMVERG